MTMTYPGRITPTEDERRAELNMKKKQDRFKRLMGMLSTAGGHSIRPTLGNMMVILNYFEEWKGVLAMDADFGLVLKAPPPFTADYDIEGKRIYPTPFTEFDLDRAMIWFEREAKMLIESDYGRGLLRRALELSTRQQRR